MNKQIIIDGVDVTKCRYFTSEWDFNDCGHICKGTECKYKRLWYKKQLKRKEQECEELKHKVELMMDCVSCKIDEYKQTLIEIIRFFKEDEKFARYSGRPIIFVKPALEKIEKILKENDIKIS